MGDEPSSRIICFELIHFNIIQLTFNAINHVFKPNYRNMYWYLAAE